MNVTRELVERIAQLARLSLSDEEKERMTVQLEDILGSMADLDKLVLEEETLPAEGANVLREDVPEQSTDPALLLDNAPETDGAYILVPDTMQGGRE